MRARDPLGVEPVVRGAGNLERNLVVLVVAAADEGEPARVKIELAIGFLGRLLARARAARHPGALELDAEPGPQRFERAQ